MCRQFHEIVVTTLSLCMNDFGRDFNGGERGKCWWKLIVEGEDFSNLDSFVSKVQLVDAK